MLEKERQLIGLDYVKDCILGLMRSLRKRFCLMGKARFLTLGKGCHIGANPRLWAPSHIVIGANTYIGRDVFIEANVSIGKGVLVANKVSFIGKNDHDYRAIGVPVRFSPWIGEFGKENVFKYEEVSVGDDVWLGYGSVLMTGASVAKGAIVAAGSLVVGEVESYSIVGGVPAKKIGMRFTPKEQEQHESMIRSGEFAYSSKGLKYSTVRPGAKG